MRIILLPIFRLVVTPFVLVFMVIELLYAAVIYLWYFDMEVTQDLYNPEVWETGQTGKYWPNAFCWLWNIYKK